ncbi:MAG: Fic-family protein [Gammaproteobacteria bacterium]|jgi:Fic family protein|nr:Fic-family protein [Gammaproteobacteria bacterium]
MPSNAFFVPPPVSEMQTALSDLEKFFHQSDDILPIVKAGLIHAQFETIPPFLDGNGRTGRMLITLFLWLEKLLDRPILFLSSYFKKHQKIYYERINGYHDGKVEQWVNFFLEGVIDTSLEAINIAKKITNLRDEDMKKIQSLGKTEAKSAMEVLFQLFRLPIINVNKAKEWTGFTRQGAYKIIKRFVDLEILQPKDANKTYGQSYIYRRYVDIFRD